MSIIYKQVIYIFNRSIDWIYLSNQERMEKIKNEMQLIDWKLIPDDDGRIDYKQYYKGER